MSPSLYLMERFKVTSDTVVIRGLRNTDGKNIPKIWNLLKKIVPVLNLDVRARYPSDKGSNESEVWVVLSSENDVEKLIATLNRKEGVTAMRSVEVEALEQFQSPNTTSAMPWNSQNAEIIQSSPSAPTVPIDSKTQASTASQRDGSSNASPAQNSKNVTVQHSQNDAPSSSLGKKKQPKHPRNESVSEPDRTHENPALTAQDAQDSTNPPGVMNRESEHEETRLRNGTNIRIAQIPTYANEEWFRDISVNLEVPLPTHTCFDGDARTMTATYLTVALAKEAAIKLATFRVGASTLEVMLMDSRTVHIRGFTRNSCSDLLLYQLWAPYGAIECVQVLSAIAGTVTYVHESDASALLSLSASSDGFSVQVGDGQEMVLTVHPLC